MELEKLEDNSEFKKYLESIDCYDFVDWIGDKGIYQFWDECENGDWMRWLAEMLQRDFGIWKKKRLCVSMNRYGEIEFASRESDL